MNNAEVESATVAATEAASTYIAACNTAWGARRIAEAAYAAYTAAAADLTAAVAAQNDAARGVTAADRTLALAASAMNETITEPSLAALQFVVPPACQGQALEVSYAVAHDRQGIVRRTIDRSGPYPAEYEVADFRSFPGAIYLHESEPITYDSDDWRELTVTSPVCRDETADSWC